VEGIRGRPEFTMDVKVVSMWSGALWPILLIGVPYLLLSSIIILMGLIENDMNKVRVGLISLIPPACFIIPLFPYRRGTVKVYENRIMMPESGFGIFRGEIRGFQYKKIKDIKVYFRFPRTDRIESFTIHYWVKRFWLTETRSTNLAIFGRGQGKYEKILNSLEKKGMQINPKNWNARRKITWRDRQILYPYVMIPLLIIISVLVVIHQILFFGPSLVYIPLLTVVILLTSFSVLMIYMSLYIRRRLKIEDLYEGEE
jgi:hypothetical protein